MKWCCYDCIQVILKRMMIHAIEVVALTTGYYYG